MENIEERHFSNMIEENEKDSFVFLKSKFFLIGLVLAVGLGILSGYFLTRKGGTPKTASSGGTGEVAADKIKPGVEFGSKTQNFKDTTIGVLEKDGISGEGTHKLIREGGPSQTAYLTSSVLDLDQFVGRKVQIWGETFKGQKASWLMDVGRLLILE